MMEIHAIREWAPLTNIIEQIPERTHKGLFGVDVNITCVDAVDDFLALGSDVGLVFWYNRGTAAMKTLKTETAVRITCVKIVNSVEFMVAAGSSSGLVNAFQIPKELPPDLDLVAPCTRPKPIERYAVRDLHHNRITCCEWSKNGMKLYTADIDGRLVLTEFDYANRQIKSAEMFRESFEVVQVSVHRTHLLVCTLYRCVICRLEAATGEWRRTQVGTKERKQLTDCGGCILRRSGDGGRNARLLCGRPGLRFWVADMEGGVEKTLLFRDAVARSPVWRIPTLNPKFGVARLVPDVAQRNFSHVLPYNESDCVLVTHDGSTLYLLDLERLSVEAVATGFRSILGLSVVGKEIFVLEGGRSLMRLAPTPEKPNQAANIIFNPAMPPPIPALGTVAGNAVDSPTAVEPSSTPTAAEGADLLDLLQQLNLNVPIELAVESPRAEQNRRLELFKRISELDFDQSIVHHSEKHKSRGLAKSVRPRAKSAAKQRSGIVEIGHFADGSGASDVVDAVLTAEAHDGLAAWPKELAVEVVAAESTVQAATGSPCESPKQQVSPSFAPLSQAYPKQLTVEDAGVQTTPRRAYGSSHELSWGEYSNGQPVDDSYLPLSAPLRRTSHPSCLPAAEDSDDVHSFLPDFRRAMNPLMASSRPPAPPETEVPSSDWEFLDN